MNFLEGIKYNVRGLWLGLKTPKLLFWGLVRFLLVIAITVVSATVILSYHQEILNFIWTKPEGIWIIFWHVLSWLVSLLLVGISAVVGYLLAQILFSILIMDYMSRLTERMLTGTVQEPAHMPLVTLFVYLIKQELPRAIVPVLISLVLVSLSFTPIGPVLTVFACVMASTFLAWDNTDLVPARRLIGFKARFRLFSKNILFHLGFGLPFLVPGVNILFLSFAPVGATLYHLEKKPANG